MTNTTDAPTWRTLDTEGHPIAYDAKSQRWDHEDAADATHDIEPELRFAVDATCPGCDFPEIGYAPGRAVFTCSRCGHEQTDRPEA